MEMSPDENSDIYQGVKLNFRYSLEYEFKLDLNQVFPVKCLS